MGIAGEVKLREMARLLLLTTICFMACSLCGWNQSLDAMNAWALDKSKLLGEIQVVWRDEMASRFVK